MDKQESLKEEEFKRSIRQKNCQQNTLAYTRNIIYDGGKYCVGCNSQFFSYLYLGSGDSVSLINVALLQEV